MLFELVTLSHSAEDLHRRNRQADRTAALMATVNRSLSVRDRVAAARCTVAAATSAAAPAPAPAIARP